MSLLPTAYTTANEIMRARCCLLRVTLNRLIPSCRPGDGDDSDSETPAQLHSQHTLAAGASTVRDPEPELQSPDFGPIGPRLDPHNPAPSAAVDECVLDGDQRDSLPAAGDVSGVDAAAASSGDVDTAISSGGSDATGPPELGDQDTAAADACAH